MCRGVIGIGGQGQIERFFCLGAPFQGIQQASFVQINFQPVRLGGNGGIEGPDGGIELASPGLGVRFFQRGTYTLAAKTKFFAAATGT